MSSTYRLILGLVEIKGLEDMVLAPTVLHSVNMKVGSHHMSWVERSPQTWGQRKGSEMGVKRVQL